MSRRKTDAERLAEDIAAEERHLAELAEEQREFEHLVAQIEADLGWRTLPEVLAIIVTGGYRT